jgi:hypothetical protein
LCQPQGQNRSYEFVPSHAGVPLADPKVNDLLSGMATAAGAAIRSIAGADAARRRDRELVRLAMR